MLKKTLNWTERIILAIIWLPISLLLGLLIWIDWKLNYKGLPIDAWGMPHPYE